MKTKTQMKFSEFIEDFGNKAKHLIEEFEKFKELKGPQRKERVDALMLSWAIPAIDTIPINFVFKLALKTLLKICLPSLTQVIFNSLEARIEGITE